MEIDDEDGKTHPTAMNAVTRISAKGQVVIPKASRDRWSFTPGTELDVIETSDGVLLRPRRVRKTLSFEEARARLREIVRYDGPPVTIEDMNETITAEWARSGARGDW